ncbi:MAG: glycosyltransferase family 39 protein [Negativicutes bacterium]|nr:glycosyltransferase family 39 protein [Negativicutes bacterium]
MTEKRSKPTVSAWLVFLATLLFYGLFTSQIPITDPVESVYAETAREMLDGHSWLSPVLFARPWYDKPPLVYWLLIAGFTIGGVSDTTARLTMAALTAVTVTTCWRLTGRWLKDAVTANWTAIILATSLAFWLIGHLIVTDMLLLLFNMLAMITVAREMTGDNRGSRAFRPYLAAGIWLGLSVLSKGPVGVVLPLVIIGLYAGLSGRLGRLSGRLAVMAAVAMAVAAPWYIYMFCLHGDEFIRVGLGLHNFTRATVSEHPDDNVWYYYLVVFPLGLMPWSACWLASMTGRGKSPADRFLWLWQAAVILFYSLVATKYPTYAFVAQVPAAIVTARFVAGRLATGSAGRRLLWVGGPVFALGLALTAGSWFVAGSRPAAAVVVLIATMAAVAAVVGRRPGFSLPALVGGLVVVMLTTVVITALPYCHSRSLKSAAAAVEGCQQTGIIGDYRTSLVFYSRQIAWSVREKIPVARHDPWAGKYTMPETGWQQFVGLPGSKAVVVRENPSGWWQRLSEAGFVPVKSSGDYTIFCRDH